MPPKGKEDEEPPPPKEVGEDEQEDEEALRPWLPPRYAYLIAMGLSVHDTPREKSQKLTAACLALYISVHCLIWGVLPLLPVVSDRIGMQNAITVCLPHAAGLVLLVIGVARFTLTQDVRPLLTSVSLTALAVPASCSIATRVQAPMHPLSILSPVCSLCMGCPAYVTTCLTLLAGAASMIGGLIHETDFHTTTEWTTWIRLVVVLYSEAVLCFGGVALVAYFKATPRLLDVPRKVELLFSDPSAKQAMEGNKPYGEGESDAPPLPSHRCTVSLQRSAVVSVFLLLTALGLGSLVVLYRQEMETHRNSTDIRREVTREHAVEAKRQLADMQDDAMAWVLMMQNLDRERLCSAEPSRTSPNITVRCTPDLPLAPPCSTRGVTWNALKANGRAVEEGTIPRGAVLRHECRGANAHFTIDVHLDRITSPPRPAHHGAVSAVLNKNGTEPGVCSSGSNVTSYVDSGATLSDESTLVLCSVMTPETSWRTIRLAFMGALVVVCIAVGVFLMHLLTSPVTSFAADAHSFAFGFHPLEDMSLHSKNVLELIALKDSLYCLTRAVLEARHLVHPAALAAEEEAEVVDESQIGLAGDDVEHRFSETGEDDHHDHHETLGGLASLPSHQSLHVDPEVLGGTAGTSHPDARMTAESTEEDAPRLLKILSHGTDGNEHCSSRRSSSEGSSKKQPATLTSREGGGTKMTSSISSNPSKPADSPSQTSPLSPSLLRRRGVAETAAMRAASPPVKERGSTPVSVPTPINRQGSFNKDRLRVQLRGMIRKRDSPSPVPSTPPTRSPRAKAAALHLLQARCETPTGSSRGSASRMSIGEVPAETVSTQIKTVRFSNETKVQHIQYHRPALRQIEATVMALNVAGFHTLLRTLRADEMIDVYTEIFSQVLMTIGDTHGMPIAITGDRMMALWRGDNAVKACETACRVQTYLHNRSTMNPSDLPGGGDPSASLCGHRQMAIKIRMGMAGGKVLWGNLRLQTAPNRSSSMFNVLGLTVNKAFALEQYNKQLRTLVLLDSFVWSKVKSAGFNVRPVDVVYFKKPQVTRQQPTVVYELVCDAGDGFESLKNCPASLVTSSVNSIEAEDQHNHHLYHEAFDAYLHGDWEKAEDLLSRDNIPVNVHVSRLIQIVCNRRPPYELEC